MLADTLEPPEIFPANERVISLEVFTPTPDTDLKTESDSLATASAISSTDSEVRMESADLGPTPFTDLRRSKVSSSIASKNP